MVRVCCPFCSSTRVVTDVDLTRQKGSINVLAWCSDCGASFSVEVDITRFRNEAMRKFASANSESYRGVDKCSWCSSTNVSVNKEPVGRTPYYVICDDCGGTGPQAPTEKEAWGRWVQQERVGAECES